MEIISTYYFDLYPIEQEDVIENFKIKMDKITSDLDLKYDIHFEDETNLNPTVPKMMGGGDADTSYPYSMFENIFNYISNAKAKVIGNNGISTTSTSAPVENKSHDSIIAEPTPDSFSGNKTSEVAPVSKPIEKVEQIQSPTFKQSKSIPTGMTEPSPEKRAEPLIEEKNTLESHVESETDFESEIDAESDSESIDEMAKDIIRVQMNVYNVKEKGAELILKIRKKG